MTSRRPDIYCDGCGDYCHSLSHRPSEAEYPKHPFYCTDCLSAVNSGVKTIKMIGFEWYNECERKLQELKDKGNLSKLEVGTIGSFAWTMYDEQDTSRKRKERVYDSGKIEKMTLEEWKEISLQNLKYFKRYCHGEQLGVLNNFINNKLI